MLKSTFRMLQRCLWLVYLPSFFLRDRVKLQQVEDSWPVI